MTRVVRVVVMCPDCQEIRLGPADVTLRLCLDDSEWSYWFVCPRCGTRSAGPTTGTPALRAIARGAALEIWQMPVGLTVRGEGPPLTMSDLVDLRAAMHAPDWIDQL